VPKHVSGDVDASCSPSPTMTSCPLVAITPSFPLLLQDEARPETRYGSDRTGLQRRRIDGEPRAQLTTSERAREGEKV
jgi:hypothetical protein